MTHPIRLAMALNSSVFQSEVLQNSEDCDSDFAGGVLDVPVVVQRQISMVQTVQKTKEIPQLQCVDNVVDGPVAHVEHVPQTHVVEKTVEISQLDVVEKTAEIPEIQTIHGTQTSESLSTAPVRQVAQSEVVEAIEIGVKTIDLEWVQAHLAGLVKPDDSDAQIKFFAAETLHGVHGNRFAKELRRRDCVMGEIWKNKPPFRLALNMAASDEIARHCKHCTERAVMELHESGTALAEGMGVPVSKMEESIAAHRQASLKTVKDPDRGPYPAYPSGKSWCEACGKTGSGKMFYHNVMSGADFAAQNCSSQGTQQPYKSQQRHQQQTVQRNKREDVKRQREREEERRGEKGREENGRKSEEKGVRKEDEEGDSKVVEDVTGWTVVTRYKRQRKIAQIFVKVNGSKATPMKVNLTDDKVEDVMSRRMRTCM